jgi:hypothetical protein
MALNAKQRLDCKLLKEYSENVYRMLQFEELKSS